MQASSPKKERVAIFGASGSIGASALSVLEQHPERFELFAVTANKSIEKMLSICIQHQPQYAVMVDELAALNLSKQLIKSGSKTQVLSGKLELERLAALAEVDILVAAIVGAAGLPSCFAA